MQQQKQWESNEVISYKNVKCFGGYGNKHWMLLVDRATDFVIS